ncbi:MAG: 3-oxoacyl-[acyl-carrier-protein] reductase [Alphaproteobacteria bacterium]|nr:3-oxoacyl-[acyl-carrier-protein] reductase [Alphaproteobacteria bacterium]
MFSVAGKTIVLTGATGGLGQAMAQSLAEAGARLLLSGTRQAALEELAAKLPGSGHKAAAGNMTDAGIGEQLINAAMDAFGQVDVVINNAGVTKDGLLLRMKDEDWQSVLDINLTAAMRICRAAIKPMMKARSGRIINISSIVGVMGNAGQTNYVASKAGLIGFTKALALEVASRGITVNAIAPGFIRTAMTDALNDAQKAAMLARIPLGVFGEAADVAGAAVYLASDAGRYVTGQTLHVNGGMYV